MDENHIIFAASSKSGKKLSPISDLFQTYPILCIKTYEKYGIEDGY